MIRKSGIVAALVANFAIAMSSAQPASLPIVNGDFEDGVDPGDTFTRLYAGQTNISGWTILPTSVDYVGGFWQASSGQRFVELDGTFGEAGGIAQAIATTPGQEYVIRFDMAGLPLQDPQHLKTMRVSAAGQVADYEFSEVGKHAGDMGWVGKTFSFAATSATTTISFVSMTDPPGNGPIVDNVTIEVVVPVRPVTWGRIKAILGTRYE